MNIVEQIRLETRPFANRPAIIEGDQSISYAQLLERIGILGKLLTDRGIGAGQRIAFHCRDGIDYVIGALALLDCGAAVVPLADSLTDRELGEAIERIDVHGILLHAAIPRSSDGRAVEKVDDKFFWQLRDATGESDSRCREMPAAFIRFSSGTTGESKGVVLSHKSIVERTDAANKGLAISERDLILWVLGMSHHFVVSILLFLRKGATIIVANQFFPFSLLEAARSHPITFIYGSPVHYHVLGSSDAVAPSALSHVRLAISTSMKMPPEVGARFTAKFGIVPAEAYGIIEIGLPFINAHPDASAPNTVGPILPDYELQIANRDADGVGEVLIRGKGMFDAYFSPWRSREACTDDGFFHTGDLGRLDDKGRLCLMGRSKTVLVCAGMKVFPEEVEEVINAMPGVRGSLVFGRDHPQFGQAPVAKIMLEGSVADPAKIINELRGFCFARLSAYKVPVEFIQVNSLPMTPSGKLARALARAE